MMKFQGKKKTMTYYIIFTSCEWRRKRSHHWWRHRRSILYNIFIKSNFFSIGNCIFVVPKAAALEGRSWGLPRCFYKLLQWEKKQMFHEEKKIHGKIWSIKGSSSIQRYFDTIHWGGKKKQSFLMLTFCTFLCWIILWWTLLKIYKVKTHSKKSTFF